MKNKTVILILSVLAVAMYTVAVINFCLGNVLSGIADVLMASSGALMAYALYVWGSWDAWPTRRARPSPHCSSS